MVNDSSAKLKVGRRTGTMLSHLWRNPWTVWVGFRYLKSKKSSGFLSLITTVSILGVGLGVCTLLVVMSVMDGFENKLKERLISSDLHLLITPTAQVPGFDGGFVPEDSFEKSAAAEELKNDPRVAALWPMASTEGIVKTREKVAGVVLKGVTSSRIERLKPQLTEVAEDSILDQAIKEQGHKMPLVYVGRELAYSLDLIPGAVITLISPRQTDESLASVPRTRKFLVAGIFHSGLPEQETTTLFTSVESVRSFLRKRDVISQWEVAVHSFDDAPALSRELQAKLPQFKVKDWIQLNATLFASLRLERVAMFVILAFIIVVASFNIVTTLTLMVMEKKREIAIMKAFGADHSEMAAVFLAEGLLIGFVGVTSGVFLGFALSYLQHRYGLIKLPDIYYDNILPVSFQYTYYVGIALCALFIVMAACIYPSRRAAQLDPLEGIRGS